MADPAKRRATYQDVLDAPSNVVAEIVGGELRLSPRPGGPHQRATSIIGALLTPPFDLGSGGPGGWTILDEPELHLGDDVIVPDLAGWRQERLPIVAHVAFFTLVPDWVCEMLSPSTSVHDRTEKLPLYAAAGVQFAWFVDVKARTLEVMCLREGEWVIRGLHRGDVRVRAEPFDAFELDLAILWAKIAAPPPRSSRVSEDGTEYHVDAK